MSRERRGSGKLRAACALALAAQVLVALGEEAPEQLKTSGQVALAPCAPPAEACGSAPAHKAESHKWVFSWRGWDGLFLEWRQSTHLKSLAEELGMPRAGSDPLADIHLEQLKLTSRLGGRVEVDGAAFTTTGNLTGFDDGVQLRRLRLLAEGDSILLVPFRYKFELGYVPNQFNLQQAYLEFSKIDYVGSLRFGQFQPPMGLQVITSSWDIPLMEPAAPLQALAPGHRGGRPGRQALRWREGDLSARRLRPGRRNERVRQRLEAFRKPHRPGHGPADLSGGLRRPFLDEVAPRRVEPRRPVLRREHRALPITAGELHRALRHRHGRHRRERVRDDRRRGLVGQRPLQPPGGISSIPSSGKPAASS